MKIKTLIVFVSCTVLSFTSCKDQSKNSQPESLNEATPSEVEKQGSDDPLVEDLKNYINTEYLTEGDSRAISEEQRKFQFETMDLNNDGNKEVFVYFNTSYFCGTGGCTILLLNDKLEPITEFTVTRPPLFFEETTENGWRTILMKSENKWRNLIYEDGTYPSNPSIVETTDDTPTESTQQLFAEDNPLESYSF